jgi:hypothetical protein
MNPLSYVLDEELAAQGVDDSSLGATDYEFAAAVIRSLVTRLKTRAAWEDHIGARLTHSQVLKLSNWTKQALSQAVRDHRVLRLESDGAYTYLQAGFDDQSPARPLPGIKDVLEPWASADPRGWAAASWLMSRQPELGGQTPREALLAGNGEQVAALARQGAARLAA